MKNNLPNRSSKGFTIVELLVVVSLIAILSGLILNVVNIRGVRAKSRDAQRAGDLKKIQTALEVMYADTRIYPCPTGAACAALNCASTANYAVVSGIPSFTGYLNPIPTDPQAATGAYCNAAAYDYWYCSNNATYRLTTNMEIASSVPAANLCSTVGTGCGLSTCYAVRNP